MQQTANDIANVICRKIDLSIHTVADEIRRTEFVSVTAEAIVPTVGDVVGVLRQRSETLRVAAQKLLTDQLQQPSPSCDTC